MNRTFLYLFLLTLSISWASCIPSPYYQKTYDIANNKWDYKNNFLFEINITDTSHYYNSFLIIRHTNNYPFSNLWLSVWVKGPKDSLFKKVQLDFPLATPQGQWLGHGMGTLYEQRRMIVLNHKETPITDELTAVSVESVDDLFRQKGVYQIRIGQNMRQNIIPDILNIGLRVEKSNLRVPTQKGIDTPKIDSINLNPIS